MKPKLDWHEMKSGSAPLPNEEVVLAFPQKEWDGVIANWKITGFTFSAGTINDRDVSQSGIYWAYLPEFEPPTLP